MEEKIVNLVVRLVDKLIDRAEERTKRARNQAAVELIRESLLKIADAGARAERLLKKYP